MVSKSKPFTAEGVRRRRIGRMKRMGEYFIWETKEMLEGWRGSRGGG